MWHPYWRNLFYKTLILLISFSAVASPPGIIESLQLLKEKQRKDFIKKRDELKSSIGLATPITNQQFKNAIIFPEFLKGVLLNSASRYINLLGKDKCSFATYLENDLLKGPLGLIQNIPIKVKSNDRPFILSKAEFLNKIKDVCPSYTRRSELFSRFNLKRTIESLNYPVPANQTQCQQIINDWKENQYLPYLCRIPESIKKSVWAKSKLRSSSVQLGDRRSFLNLKNLGDFYNNNISFNNRHYLKQLCFHLDEPKKFCAPFLAKDIWSKVISKEYPQYLLEYKCRELYRSTTLTKDKLRNCALKLKSNPELCTHKTFLSKPALTPGPDCNEISQALSIGRLKTKYHDCPGLIHNSKLTHTHRLIRHFSNKEFKDDSENCSSPSFMSLANLYTDFKSQNQWPLNICYFDPIENDEVCKMYVPGVHPGSKFSEDLVVTNILKRITPYTSSTNCKIIPKKQYNPLILEYKVGCYILVDQKTCSKSPCPREIIVKENKIDKLKYEGLLLLDFLPIRYSERKYSIINILEETMKLKSKNINNFTQLAVFLDQKKSGLIHGIACGETIYPQKFSNFGVNSCTPLPFIIDGHLKKTKQLSIRTAYDDVHSPWLISWSYLYNGVLNYQQRHPLRTWAFYGIY